MIKNSDAINNIFATTGLDNQEEKIKRLVREKTNVVFEDEDDDLPF